MTPLLWELVAGGVGAERATWLLHGLVIHLSLVADGDPARVPRAVLAQALGVLLLDDLLARVPSGAAYVGEKVARGERVFLDHGAVRTVAGVSCGSLPPGQESVTRVLSALGYVERETYHLARLHMVGRSWASVDLAADLPQYFVSELDARSFSPDFRAAAERVLSTSRDPLRREDGPPSPSESPLSPLQLLASLAAEGGLKLDQARSLLPVMVSCFNRHH
ncbi:MAG TPA: hypothetical protein VGR90_03135, partial [Acidimicrobiales bacterium]|nr:hypothetical protein [Acidimicrobiales bacterium]